MSSYTRVLDYLVEKANHEEVDFRNYLILKILIETGIRIGELLNLKTIDILNEKSGCFIKIVESTTTFQWAGFHLLFHQANVRKTKTAHNIGFQQLGGDLTRLSAATNIQAAVQARPNSAGL